MRKLIGKVVLLSVLIFAFSIYAQVPQPTWIGVHSLMPKAMTWSATCAYNGKIYVFGGNENDAETNTTYIYDIATDTWSEGAPMPTPRYLATAVVVDGKIYVMGGRQLVASMSPVDANECYDPATNTWTTKAAMPNAIRGHAAVAANGKIYVLGGNTGAYTDAVKIYDPATNSWANGPTMPVKAAYGGAVYSPSTNSIYWVGGVKSSTASASNFIGKIYQLSLSTNQWDAGTNMPYKTAYFGLATDPQGTKVYIAGGLFWSSSDNDEAAYPFIQVFNTSTKTFEENDIIPISPWDRAYGNAVFEAQRLWLLNGEGNRTIDEYDPSSDAWYEPLEPINDGVQYQYITGAVHGALNGKYYVADGGFFSPLEGLALEYDPAANRWTKKFGTDSIPRLYCSGGVWNDSLVVYGGIDESSNLVNRAAIYDPLADTFTYFQTPNPRPTLFEASVVYNNKLYLFGGRSDITNAESLTKYTNILDLNSGSWSQGPDMPVALESARAAELNGKIYIFGGIDNQEPDYLYDKVIIFDPATNSFTTQATIPYPEYGGFAFAYNNYIFLDSGYNLYYNDVLGGLSGGILGIMQVYSPASGQFASVPRPYGVMFHGGAVIGDSYYTTTGETPDWPNTRVVKASFGGGGCVLTCSASATPTSGAPPLTVQFTANASATGCSGTPQFNWNFGDGSTSTSQNPSHTYNAEGTYHWTLTVTVDNQTCTKSGTITVSSGGGCTLTCDASATPTSGNAPLTVNFSATATATGCTGSPQFSWNFGDGSSSTQQNVTHTYTQPGTYNWTLTVTADNQTCTKNGTITVSGGQQAPVINSVKKASDPFRLIIIGANFENGCVVKINNVNAPKTTYKNSTKVVAKGGSALKQMVPKGQTVYIKVVNPDGSESNEYAFTR